LTEVTNVSDSVLRRKNRGLPGASGDTLSAAGAFPRVNADHAGRGIFGDGLRRTSQKARRCQAVAADGHEEKAFFLSILLDPDQRKMVVKGTLLLKGAGELTGPATRTDLFIDPNHHFPPLFFRWVAEQE
jgi:hypothetical protein